MLVTDCFMAASYALGGPYIGYRANYYSASLYRSMVDYCGFDAAATSVESGANGINHVLVAPCARIPLETEVGAALMLPEVGGSVSLFA